MSEKPNQLKSFTQQDQLEREKIPDEGTSLTTSSMVWHPYHMTHTSTYNYINFPTQGSGHFVLQRGNCPAEAKKILRFFQGTIVYIHMYMELPPSRNRWATMTQVHPGIKIELQYIRNTSEIHSEVTYTSTLPLN